MYFPDFAADGKTPSCAPLGDMAGGDMAETTAKRRALAQQLRRDAQTAEWPEYARLMLQAAEEIEATLDRQDGAAPAARGRAA